MNDCPPSRARRVARTGRAPLTSSRVGVIASASALLALATLAPAGAATARVEPITLAGVTVLDAPPAVAKPPKPNPPPKPAPPTFAPGFPWSAPSRPPHAKKTPSTGSTSAPDLPSTPTVPSAPDVPTTPDVPTAPAAPPLPAAAPLPTAQPAPAPVTVLPANPAGPAALPQAPASLPEQASAPGGQSLSAANPAAPPSVPPPSVPTVPTTPPLPTAAPLPTASPLATAPALPNLPTQNAVPGSTLPTTGPQPTAVPQPSLTPPATGAVPDTPPIPTGPPLGALPPGATPPTSLPTPSGGTPQAAGASKTLKIWLTGYSWQDNTPPGSSIVSHPILHKDAGGTGTYEDPITVAVPGQGNGIWKAGAKFYLPSVKRYVIVEDTGASKPPSGQDGHLDMWIGGQGGTKSATDQCMNKITGTGKTAIFNPPPGEPVMSGPIFANGSCNVPGADGHQSTP